MEYVLAIITFAVGFLLAYLFSASKLSRNLNEFHRAEKQLIDDKSNIERQLLIAQEMLKVKTDGLDICQGELAQNLGIANLRAVEIATFKATQANLLEKIEKQTAETEQLQKRLTAEFENIANKILKERSEEFSASNHKNISEILNPLKDKIQGFEKKVEDTYEKDMRDRVSLREEVRKLSELNTKISEEANNLTRALKGDVKKQGNWGEVILERVLERSGLTKGQEYDREVVVEGADNSVQRPDVIIHLPENKHIIIDSKVSLVAYERFSSAKTETEQASALKEHISSFRSHVKLLSDKNYQNALNLNTPDFVLMFVPVEASFSVAVQGDSELFVYAWDRKIVIVSPTTLLATLRTISSIWKQENQTRNAQEIARLSGSLYDKFIGFTEDMVKIKANIDRTSESYNDAVKKMKDGNGNIIRTAEKIKELGAKTGNKNLPSAFSDF